MEKIKTVWFDADRIYMKTQEGKVYSRPLEAYPDLKDASPEQRSDYVIGDDGEDRFDNIGAVESTAKSYFDDSNIHVHLCEIFECHSGGYLEERRLQGLDE